MTLDEYLAETDKWKQPLSDRLAGLPPLERGATERDAIVWLEQQLGRLDPFEPERTQRARPEGV